ncbi:MULTISPECIES: hypothetical protein [Photorhabdus]|nr:hypothetical protein [Photorhabdus asymbiotica]RKS59555.1 hypothetical protein BDD30_1631 [Photorhabdus asymbiotica]CAQ85687.1 hypothetical protein PAU_03599 [Photorhabdus asymbiotica]
MEVKEKIATAFLSMRPDNPEDTNEIIRPIVTKAVSRLPEDLFLYVTLSILGLTQGKSYKLFIDILHNGESCIKYYNNPYGDDGEEFVADNKDLPANQVSAIFNIDFPVIAIPDTGIYEIKVRLRDSNGELLDENSYYFDIIKRAGNE